jgi:3-methylcrotonyl-CoA carboxylase alpha subunit/geranyl-CoA carboxylase alpha subunit
MIMVRRLLIANRGEIARRVMRTALRMGIATIAVHSDADAAALHASEADVSVALGGERAADSYLRIDKLIAAARAAGADAVHPGYGFLSENADFAQAVLDAGLVWVGPPPEAIRVLGSKSSIKHLAATLDVPCLPGFARSPGEARIASGLRDGHLVAATSGQEDEPFIAAAGRIGYPVMIKAAAGGGGRGMRLVRRADDLAAALATARSEAEAAFGSAELLLERALPAPRHVEVQIVADAHGRCIHLGERDCSVQRRHQKVIEESPSPAVDPSLRERMGACAVRLARSAGYVGAGTVEFLVDGEAFYLMEMNTRLQVEHPVTELCNGIDLVEWQLRIARGEPLPLAQDDVAPRGHAIEVRLVAEDEQFSPHAGIVQRFVAPHGVRMDHALADGVPVPPWYDSMLGKLAAHAATRDAAIDALVAALESTVVLGVPTNRRLLAAALRDPVFRSGQALVPFLAERGDALRAAVAAHERGLRPLLVAAAWCAQGGGASPLPVPFERPMRVRHRDEVIDARVRAAAPDGLCIRIGERTTTVRCLRGDGDRAARLVVDGVATPLQWARLAPGEWHVQLGPVDAFVADVSFEPAVAAARSAVAEIRAPFSGRIVAVHVAAGRPVAAGDTLIVIESMKLEHTVAAPRSATIAQLAVEVGQQVSPQQVLLILAAS